MADKQQKRGPPKARLPRHAAHQQDLIVALQAGASALEALHRHSQAQKLRAIAGGLTSILMALKKFSAAIEEGPPPKRQKPAMAATPHNRAHADAVTAARDAAKAERERLTATIDAAVDDTASLASAEAEMLT
eukprot:scpid109040/ scgid34358/ 